MLDPIVNCVAENRIGKLRIRRDFLLEIDNDALRTLYGQFVIVRAEYMFIDNYIEYLAYSELFAVADRAQHPPLYDIVLRSDDDGAVTFCGVRKNLWHEDIAPPTDCDALGRPPTFEERSAANREALEEIREFVYGG